MPRVAVGRHEANKLHHHNERAGGGFGHAEAVEHFARAQPAKDLDRLLGDIGQN